MISDGLRTIDYDYDNMPRSITYNNSTTSFVYDGNGARVKKDGYGGTTVYIGKLYDCIQGACNKYIYANGTRIASKSSGDIFYYHHDHLGSSRVITGDIGENLEQVYYDPFGDAVSDTGAVSVTHKYTSQELDRESGLYYYNARYYNPALGRFTSPDTIVPDPSNPQALNRYSYVLNNPMIYTDPSGHSFWKRAHNWAKKPWHAVLIQSIDKGMGTYLLSQTTADTG
jgi:RHS repeat-associated protein